MTPPSPKSLRETAKAWAAAGLSVVPIRADGSKAPAIESWRELQDRILTEEEIDQHFKPGLGIAIIAGEVSGNLEFLDFDVPKDKHGNAISECIFNAWLDCLDVELFELVQTMPSVRTPGGGAHLYYRCEYLEGNKKLAMQINPPGVEPSKSTIAETRGRGGYVLAPGCPAKCHPSGKLYKLVTGSFGGEGDGEGVPVITPEQRAKIFASIRSFDQSDLAKKEARRKDPSIHPSSQRDGNRPGDDFNRRAKWEDILEPEGWTFAYHRRHDGAHCWRRPGKPERERGISATVRDIDGIELFHSFSSNSDPLPHDESITKFTAYTLFSHNGDYEAAARELGKQGYGEPPRRILELDTVVDGRRDDSVPWGDDAPPGVTTRVEDASSFEEEAPEDLPFDEWSPAPFEASVLHSEMDPLEVHLHEDEEKLENDEIARKRKEKLQRRQVEMSKGPAYLVWRDYGDEPQRSLTKDGRIKTYVDRPRDTVWLMLKDIYSSPDGVRKIHYQNTEFMVWNGERYRALGADDIRPKISRQLSHFAEHKSEDEDGVHTYTPYKIRNVRMNEIVKTIQDMVHIDTEISDPCWLCDTDEEDLPDPREIVCCKNGLLDIANRELLPPTPALYSFNNTGIVYDPAAPEPKAWLAFLESSLDKDSQLLLQQWFGYCLVQDTRLQKMLMVVGKPGSGKGTAMAILRRLVGDSSCCAMTFDKFDANFGLQNAIGKSLMIFPDARQNAKFDIKGSAVGAILSITGEDEIQIDRKNVAPVTRRLNTRLVVVSNEVMQLTDRSKALSRRMLWIKFPGHTRSSDPNLKKKLLSELSGILNWAVEGWAMVRSTGGFTQPQSAEQLRNAFEEQSSDIASFIEDMCVVGEDKVVEKVELVHHWNAWRISKGYRKMGEAVFGKLLSSAVMRLEAKRRRVTGSGRKNFYIGIGLDAEKVTEYAEEYGGSSVWKDLLRTMTGGGKGGGSGDVLTIAEYLERNNKDKK